MSIDKLSSYAQVIWFGAVTVGSIYGGLKFWFKFSVKLENLEKYTYKENGGSSLKDALNRLEKNLADNTRLTNKAFSAIAKLEGRLENHIQEGKNERASR